jgi:exosortase/archaeosortase family protein
MLGLPLHQDGVQIYVRPNPEADPVYSIVVAKACSGLTSMMVLLALGYLTALFTPAKMGWRVLLFASVIPLALLANAVRLTIILLFGTHWSAAAANWVHDNEAPVLIFACSLGLMGLRYAVLSYLDGRHSGPESRGDSRDQVPLIAD